MQLEIYKKSDFYEDYISSQKEYYERENADAYFAERLAEKDKEIALLKEHICNGDVSRATWIDDCFDKDKEIAELKEKLRDHCIHCPVKEQEDDVVSEKEALINDFREMQRQLAEKCGRLEDAIDKKDDEIAELKQKLENVQASMYADVVDANMDNRRLKRALYKACANWAMNARMVEIETEPWGENHESRLWASVYDKCLKKAEEYK